MRDGIITIGNMNSMGNQYFVDFWGHNEGSASPCKDEMEVKECVNSIVKQHQSNYNIKIIDERIKQLLLDIPLTKSMEVK